MNLPLDPLDELLNQCASAPEPPAQLAQKIHRQIAAQPATPSPSWVARLDVVFARPSFAVAFVAACMLLGLFLAEARLSRWHAARGAEIARSYVQLIDPILQSTPPPPVAPARSP